MLKITAVQMSELSIDEQFAVAVNAYKRRDPRPLGNFVLTNDLTAEQRDFVAKALCGDVEQVDGRTVKPTTEAIMYQFYLLKSFQEFASVYAGRNGKVNKSEIAAYIAHKLGYDDVESVRRTINRQVAKMKSAPVTTKQVLAKVGHEKK